MAEIGRLGAMARWRANGDRRGRLICETLCRHRVLAAALAPFAVRSVPAAATIDGGRYTWTSYHRTLSNAVLAEPASLLLSQVECLVSAIFGVDDRACRPDYARRLAHDDPACRWRSRPASTTILPCASPSRSPGRSWPRPAKRSRNGAGMTAQESSSTWRSRPQTLPSMLRSRVRWSSSSRVGAYVRFPWEVPIGR